MKRMFRFAMAVGAAMVVFVTGAWAQGKGKPSPGSSTNDAVSITFRDASSDNIRSDGQGTYLDGVESVNATGGAGLIFSTNASKRGASRAVFFQFSDCLSSCTSGQRPFFAQETLVKSVGKVLTLDGTAFDPDGLIGIPIGEERSIALKLYLPDFTDDWTVCFNPPGVADLVGICSLNTQGTPAHIKRISQGTWEIYATSGDVAALIKGTLNSRKATATVEGTYSMPFLMTVTCVDLSACPAP